MRAEVSLALDDLVARYALFVDRRELDRAAALFAGDGRLVLPDPPESLDPVTAHTGRAAVRTALAAVMSVPRTFHALCGQVYDAGGSDVAATGTVACVANHAVTGPQGEPLDLEWHLRYADDYIRTDDGWRFAQRSVHVDLVRLLPVRRWRATTPPLAEAPA